MPRLVDDDHHGHLLCVMFQQIKPAVHKLLGARMYDSRSRRPKLKATDRRPTLDMIATQDDDELTGNSCMKPPQTVDEMRRLRNRRMQNAQQVIKPYVGKRTAVVEQDGDVNEARCASEHVVAAVAANTVTSSYNMSTSDSTASCDATDVHVRSVKCRGSGRSSSVKSRKCQDSATAHSADTSCLQKEKLEQYLQAVG